MKETATWIETVRTFPVGDLAGALHLKVSPPTGTSGGAIYGCPVCGAECRHTRSRDRRGAIGIRADGLGWRCFQCEAGGDGLDLVARVLRGGRYRDLLGVERADVRAWCLSQAGMRSVTASMARQRPVPATRGDVPPTYPRLEEVAALWASCIRADGDEQVADYLIHRRLHPGRVADRGLARALPSKSTLPSWANCGGRPWTATGHRLIVPMRDERGAIRSVLARSVGLAAPSARKSLAPAGYQRAGLVLACPLGANLLAAGSPPSWWPTDCDLCVVIAEGEIDTLAWATQWSDAAECAPATFGIVSGSWTSAVAARLPQGVRVVIATDSDEQGDHYAAAIATTLAHRATLERWRASRAT